MLLFVSCPSLALLGRRALAATPSLVGRHIGRTSRTVMKVGCDSVTVNAGPQRVRREVARTTVKRKIVMYVGYDGAPYHGLQRNEGVETVSDVLEQALRAAGAISEENYGFLSKVAWVAAARTDKGVSAAGNAVSFKAAFPKHESSNSGSLKLDFESFVTRVNAHLPDHVRVFGATKPTGSFSAKDACSGRNYEYLLPRHAIPAEMSLAEFGDILKSFEGSHYFHNFTVGKEHRVPPPPQASRYILKCTCEPETVSLGGEDRDKYVRIRLKGQSFMLHQIRKMVSLSVMEARGLVPKDSVSLSLRRDVLVNVAPAPAVGLFLDSVYYDAYNKQHEGSLEVPVELDSCVADRDAFKFKHIFPSIARRVAQDDDMAGYFCTISSHPPEFDAVARHDAPGGRPGCV